MNNRTLMPLVEPLFEVIVTHPETCRSNLVCWDLHELEARRILRELEDAQRARQGDVPVGGTSESGWVYSTRPQGQAPPAPHANGVAARPRRLTKALGSP